MLPTRFEIPEQMRDAANRSVDQAKKAFEQFLDAVGKAAAAAEGSAKSLGENAADLNRQAQAFVAASFDLVQRLAQARSFEEMTALQQEFLKRQMEAIASKFFKVELTEAAAPELAVPPQPHTDFKVRQGKPARSPAAKSHRQRKPAPKSAAKKSRRGGGHKRKA